MTLLSRYVNFVVFLCDRSVEVVVMEAGEHLLLSMILKITRTSPVT